MEPGLEGNRPGRLNSPTILGHTPEVQTDLRREVRTGGGRIGRNPLRGR
jgi:hypothetical protein